MTDPRFEATLQTAGPDSVQCLAVLEWFFGSHPAGPRLCLEVSPHGPLPTHCLILTLAQAEEMAERLLPLLARMRRAARTAENTSPDREGTAGP